MGCGTVILKIFTGILQTIFIIVGLSLVAYGSFSTYSILITNSEKVIREYATIVPSAVTITLGALLIVMVIVGCCGICRESPSCMETYSAFLILLGLAHLALGGYCVLTYWRSPNPGGLDTNSAYVTGIRRQIKDDIINDMSNYVTVSDSQKRMDRIQSFMLCCGDEEPKKEYNFYSNDLPNNSELPISCCRGEVTTCAKTSGNINKDGCSELIFNFTVFTNYALGWISVVVGITELIASLLGICLSCCIWRNQMGTWR